MCWTDLSKRITGLLVLWLLTSALPAQELSGVTLPSLTGSERVALETFEGTPTLLTFFEPECPWCARQMKDYGKLRDQCRHPLNTVLVGIHGNGQRLRMTLRRYRATDLPAFMATPQLLERTGPVPATPYTLVLNAEGQVVTTLRGYVPLSKLCQVAAILNGEQASAP